VPALGGLSSRRSEVLLAVVREYVRTGQPVASRAALARAGLEVSAATVRAVMGELMQLGLLAQPHASAGRIPTDPAFRLWVDHLLAGGEAAGAVSDDVDRALDDSPLAQSSPRRAAQILTHATGQLGFCMGFEGEQLALRHVHFVRVSAERVLVVLVGATNVVRQRVIEESQSDQRALDAVSSRLSELVAGCTLEQARRRLAAEVARLRDRRHALARKLAELGAAGLMHEPEAELYVGDRTRLITQPEFADVERMREVLGALEEKERMLRLLDEVVRSDALRVAIGAELGDPGVRQCAVVSGQVGEDARFGGVGVIGPVRMRYDRVIPIVRYVAERLGDRLGERNP
jgi:heat-inducible transcriptional repressor